jgi:hypothetical protein
MKARRLAHFEPYLDQQIQEIIKVVNNNDDITALKEGSDSQTFQVAPAIGENHAVNLGQFLNSKVANGYQKLPGGLIIQWGEIPPSSTSRTFPISFPYACFGLTMSNADNFAGNWFGYTSVSKSGFTLAGSYGYRRFYMAIGY